MVDENCFQWECKKRLLWFTKIGSKISRNFYFRKIKLCNYFLTTLYRKSQYQCRTTDNLTMGKCRTFARGCKVRKSPYLFNQFSLEKKQIVKYLTELTEKIVMRLTNLILCTCCLFIMPLFPQNWRLLSRFKFQSKKKNQKAKSFILISIAQVTKTFLLKKLFNCDSSHLIYIVFCQELKKKYIRKMGWKSCEIVNKCLPTTYKTAAVSIIGSWRTTTNL